MRPIATAGYFVSQLRDKNDGRAMVPLVEERDRQVLAAGVEQMRLAVAKHICERCEKHGPPRRERLGSNGRRTWNHDQFGPRSADRDCHASFVWRLQAAAAGPAEAEKETRERRATAQGDWDPGDIPLGGGYSPSAGKVEPRPAEGE